ncbi:MAG TPA: AsmA family protein, partial [Burkholderiaceae bacterium]|nr:AsmA family protein [Burkholderiaceae bacterium]
MNHDPDSASRTSYARRHPAWVVTIVVLMALLAGFVVLASNVQWLRGPFERTVSASLKREFTTRAMRLSWSNGPILTLDDVVLSNITGGSEPQMARVKSMQITLSLLELLRGHIVLPEVTLDGADVLLEELQDGRQNWVVGNEDKAKGEKPRSRLRLDSVSLTQGRFRYLDHRMPLDMTVMARALDQRAKDIPHDSDSAQRNVRYGLTFAVTGHYRDNQFSGEAQSGGVLSLADSGIRFPLQLEIKAGETQLRMEGTIANVTQLSGVDMRIQLAGPTLANIYPFLLLPLPASPPYSLHGRLRRDGPRYALQELGGRIGSTDLEGEGSYVTREPRPLLIVQLRSK